MLTFLSFIFFVLVLMPIGLFRRFRKTAPFNQEAFENNSSWDIET
jgi:hypothetical protein